jgi:hypothetical protein
MNVSVIIISTYENYVIRISVVISIYSIFIPGSEDFI